MNKKGQVGETITWVVATLIIVFVLTFSVYLSSVIAQGNKIVSLDASSEEDFLIQNSVFSYLFTNSSEKEIVFEQIVSDKSFNSFSRNLGEKAFNYTIEKKQISLSLRLIDKSSEGFFSDPSLYEINLNPELKLKVQMEDEATI